MVPYSTEVRTRNRSSYSLDFFESNAYNSAKFQHIADVNISKNVSKPKDFIQVIQKKLQIFKIFLIFFFSLCSKLGMEN